MNSATTPPITTSLSGTDLLYQPLNSTSGPYFYSPDQLPTQHVEWRESHTRVMRHVGQKMKLPSSVLLVALYYYHRLSSGAYPGLVHLNMEESLLACFSLAMKAQETPKRLREVYAEIHAAFSNSSPDYEAKEFNDIRERILNYERVLLENMEFDTTVHLPHRFILSICHELCIPKDITQSAWRISYDCFRTPLCIQKTPQTIAIASIWLASLRAGGSIPPKLSSRELLQRCHLISLEDIQETVMFLLNMYSTLTGLEWSQEEARKLMAIVETLFSRK